MCGFFPHLQSILQPSGCQLDVQWLNPILTLTTVSIRHKSKAQFYQNAPMSDTNHTPQAFHTFDGLGMNWGSPNLLLGFDNLLQKMKEPRENS